jgi:hypothetical protein
MHEIINTFMRNQIKLKEYNRQHYLKIRVYRRDEVLDRQRFIRGRVRELKVELGCSLCGYNKCARALQFHHLSGKDENVARMAAQGRSMKRILEEIDKCVCVCANCHAELHDEKEKNKAPKANLVEAPV